MQLSDYGGGVDNNGNGENIETLSVQHASTVSDIQTTLAQLHDRESVVTARLNALVASQKDLSRELGRLDLLRAQLGLHAVATRSISNGMLSDAASTAHRISGAVKSLDLEQARVISTLGVVEQVVELKACVLGVIGSMGAPQDWETAAGYLNRASQIPKEVIDGSFAEEIVPTAEVPDTPRVTLNNAAESLCGLFLREFEKAAQEADGAKVTRFFKLFPLIGKSDIGLDVYGRYVCQGVSSRARSNLNAVTGGAQRKEGFFYANALTKLFEHVAQIVEQHGGLVERHYGAGRMVRVIERLQMEADMQSNIIIETWNDERNIDRKLTDIRSYAFTFLVKSFLPTQATRSGTPRAGSPAVRDTAVELQIRGDDNIDMKDIDGILSEIAVMLGRWSLYMKFISTKCKKGTSSAESDTTEIPLLLSNSSLSKKIAEKLITPFNIMTTFFFRRSVEKAFQLDEQPSGLSLNLSKTINTTAPYITSAIDDVMYVVNQIVQRSLATSQPTVIASVLPTIARVLGSDFIGMMQRKMRDESYPKAAIQGALPPEHVIVAFLVLLNNLDIADDYLKRIVQSHTRTSASSNATKGQAPSGKNFADLFPFNHDSTLVYNSLNSLQHTFEVKTAELISDGIYVMFKNVMKPRLRPVLADSFRNTDYHLSEEELDEIGRDAGEENGETLDEDVVSSRFERGWNALTKPIARITTERNYERLLMTMVSYLSEVLEKRIWSYYGRLNEIGAVRLERDIAGIISIVVRGGRYGLRDAFARCTQICLILNMEGDEWDELQGQRDSSAAGIEWKIDRDERLRARAIIRDSR